jgi:hypothetical protein
MQETLVMKERTDRGLKNELHRLKLYTVLPTEMDEDTFSKRLKVEGNNEKMLLNLHVYFLKICLSYSKHKTLPEKEMEKMKADKKAIPSYKSKQESDENYNIVSRAFKDAKTLKIVYEAYTAFIQKEHNAKAKGGTFHYITFN